MRTSLLACVLLAAAGCVSQTDSQPAPVVAPLAPIATLTLTANQPTAAHQVLLIATAVDAAGKPAINQPVTFETSAGTIDPPVATTDGLGQAESLLTALTPATVTVRSGSVSSTTTTQVVNPVLLLTVSSSNPQPAIGDGVTFTALVAGGVPPMTFAWDLGDGGSSPARVVTHAYASGGQKSVSVRATDAVGQAAASALTVTVQTPSVVVTPPPAPGPTLAATLTCTTPTTLPDATACNVNVSYNGTLLPSSAIRNIDWDWGDGAFEIGINSPFRSHRYPQPGSYNPFAAVTATTIDGDRTARASVLIVVTGTGSAPPPID